MTFPTLRRRASVLLAAFIAAAHLPVSAYEFRFRLPGLRVAPASVEAPPSAPVDNELPAQEPDGSPEGTPALAWLDPVVSFGTLTAGGTTTRSVTLRNTGDGPAEGVYVELTPRPGLVITSNSCGTQDLPVTLAPLATCSVTMSWSPSGDASLGGAALVATVDDLSAATSLAGTAGAFDAAGQWSTAYNSQTAPSSAWLDFGSVTPNAPGSSGLAGKVVYLRNASGTHGALGGMFAITGDTEHFVLQYVSRADGLLDGHNCTGGNGRTSLCEAQDPASGGVAQRNHLKVTLWYKPQALGTHSVTLTAVTNGTPDPEPLVFTGTGAFNPTGTWSMSSSNVQAPGPSDLTYGNKSVGSSTAKTFFMRNTGTNGPLSVRFALEGDAEHFEISVVAAGSLVDKQNCNGGDGRTTPCTATDVYPGNPGTAHLRLTVRYKPTAPGNHSVQFIPIGENGTTVPAPLTLVGSAS